MAGISQIREETIFYSIIIWDMIYSVKINDKSTEKEIKRT